MLPKEVNVSAKKELTSELRSLIISADEYFDRVNDFASGYIIEIPIRMGETTHTYTRRPSDYEVRKIFHLSLETPLRTFESGWEHWVLNL